MDQEVIAKPSASTARPRPYSNYRFRAVVDWVHLRIVTKNPTNFSTLRNRMGIPYAKAANEQPGKVATEFDFRIQEPTSWNEVCKTLEKFTHDHPLAAPVEVIGIEIAFDAYSDQEDPTSLVDIVAHFYKFAATMVSDNRRTSGAGANSSEGIVVFKALRKRLSEGFNIYVGNDSDPLMQHLYVKKTNHSNNTVVQLPRNECRGRMEIKITGEALPHRYLTDWMEHDFTTEADFFKFRKLKEIDNPAIAHAVEYIAQVGAKNSRSVPGGGTRLYSVNTRADEVLNALSYSALRELTRRMNA